jgi:hypothetical protein
MNLTLFILCAIVAILLSAAVLELSKKWDIKEWIKLALATAAVLGWALIVNWML